MKKNTFYIAVIIIFFKFELAYAKKTLKISTLEWPPYISENQNNYGFFGEITQKILNKIGYEAQIHFMPWARAINLTQDGKYDGIIPTYYSQERAKYLLYSDPIFSSKIVFFKQKNSNIKYSKLSDLKKYTIGVVRGYVTSPEFDNATYLNKDETTSDESNINKLCKGRVDLIPGDPEIINYIIKTKFKECLGKLETIKNAS